MKRITFVFFFLCSFFNTQITHAQDSNNPWIGTFGTNAINNPVRMLPGEEGRFKTWNWDAAGLRFTVGRAINNRFAFESVISLNTVALNFSEFDDNFPYVSLDGMFKAKITKGVRDFDPYVTIGGGYTWLDTVGAGTINGGVGINYWLGAQFGLTAQTVYKHAFEDYGLPHFQHSFGIALRVGGKDSDKDGINDKDDACPEIFGVFAANGCPDADGDGVVDSEDLCPNTFGPEYYRGCPDRDGDGTPDKYDSCPDEQGKIDDDGCPIKDSDNDGVEDRKDKCPNEAGSANNDGCPVSILSQQPQNPSISIAEKERIGNLKRQLSNQVNTLASTITFENGNEKLTIEGTKSLDNIAQLISPLVKLKFHIAGHTDNTGGSESNMLLSNKRAQNARTYLIQKGVAENMLTAQGYGEENPIADNKTDEGRKKNRRIEFFIIE